MWQDEMIELKFDKAEKPYKLVDIIVGKDFHSLEENVKSTIMKQIGEQFSNMIEEEPQNEKRFDYYLFIPATETCGTKEVN